MKKNTVVLVSILAGVVIFGFVAFVGCVGCVMCAQIVSETTASETTPILEQIDITEQTDNEQLEADIEQYFAQTENTYIEPTQPQPSERVDVPQDGIVMFDESNIVISVTGVNRNRQGYVTDIDFMVENNGEDEISIRIVPNIWSVVQINNLTFSGNLSARVMPGRRSSERLRLNSNEVEIFGLRNIYTMTIQFQTDVPSDSFMIEGIVIYEPSTVIIADGEHGNSFLDAGVRVFTSEHADIYAFGVRGRIVSRADFVVRNNTGRDARFRFGSVSVDGLMSDRFEQSEDVFANTYRIMSVPIDSTDISEIEFVLREEEFLQIISFDRHDIGVVNVVYD